MMSNVVKRTFTKHHSTAESLRRKLHVVLYLLMFTVGSSHC